MTWQPGQMKWLNKVPWGQTPIYTPEQDAEYQRGFRALMLSTSLETYQALLNGEPVPLNQLDQQQAARYGLRT